MSDRVSVPIPASAISFYFPVRSTAARASRRCESSYTYRSHPCHGLRILEAVDEVNRDQKKILLKKVTAHFADDGGVAGKRIAVWGLSFKPRTDDMREAPSIDLIQGLIDAGASVVGYDPEAMENAASILERPSNYATNTLPVWRVGCFMHLHWWSVFRRPDFGEMARLMKGHIILMAETCDPTRLTKRGFTYYAIGRGLPLPV